MGYRFIKTPSDDNKFDISNVEVSVDNNYVTRDDLLALFTDFLRGCGFVVEGSLEVIEESEGEA